MGEQLTASEWLGRFSEALASGEVDRVTGLFGDECYWRDLTSMTWNLHTAEGREQIGAMLSGVEPGAWPTVWAWRTPRFGAIRRTASSPNALPAVLPTPARYRTGTHGCFRSTGRAMKRLKGSRAWCG